MREEHNTTIKNTNMSVLEGYDTTINADIRDTTIKDKNLSVLDGYDATIKNTSIRNTNMNTDVSKEYRLIY